MRIVPPVGPSHFSRALRHPVTWTVIVAILIVGTRTVISALRDEELSLNAFEAFVSVTSLAALLIVLIKHIRNGADTH